MIEDVPFHNMKDEEKWFRMKWLGYKLLDDSCDMSESKLLASGYPVEDLSIYPSFDNFKKRKKNKDSQAIFANDKINMITKVSINDLFVDKESPPLADEHLKNVGNDQAKNLSTENMTLLEGLRQDPVMAMSGVIDEIKTIISFGTWQNVHKEDLTEEEIKNMLSCFMFLNNKFGKKKKTIETIKARFVAGGGHLEDRG